MNRKITRLALAAKCGGRGASGSRSSTGTLAARPSSCQQRRQRHRSQPTPHWAKKCRRVVVQQAAPRSLIGAWLPWLHSLVMNSSRFNITRATIVQAAARASSLARGPRGRRHLAAVFRRRLGKVLPLHLQIFAQRRSAPRRPRLAGQASAERDSQPRGIIQLPAAQQLARQSPARFRKTPDRWPSSALAAACSSAAGACRPPSASGASNVFRNGYGLDRQK